MDTRILDLVATVVECVEPPPGPVPGHPRTQTVRVLATLRQFLREGTPWRSLRASAGQASGATLRRTFKRWARTGLLGKVHALLVAMLRGNPTLILAAFAVMARIKTVFADRGYDAESSRAMCRRFGAEPRIHKRRQPSGSGLGKQRWPVEGVVRLMVEVQPRAGG